MSVFFVAHVSVKNPEKFQEYAAGAAASMAPFGGELLKRGAVYRELAGKQGYSNVAIVSFPDQKSLDSWFESDAYQALIPLRDEASEMLLTAFSSPE